MESSKPNIVCPEVRADLHAVIDHVVSRKPLDEELLGRVRERSRKAQEELVRKYGVREMAVDLIREGRDEE